MKKSSLVPLLVSIMAGAMVLASFFTATTYAALPSIPSSIEVAVGYADTETRGSNAGTCNNCFPNPWCGSTGVQFIGSSTNYDGNPTDANNCMGGDWDTAAILVTNTGLTPITLTNLTVVLPLPASGNRGSPYCPEPPLPITFKLWFGQQYYFGNKSTPAYNGSSITIPAGGRAIFAGTSSDGSYTCPTGNYPASPPKATYDFDTSDANFLTGCTQTNDTVSEPQVTFSAAGYAATTYIDKGHVLDTAGIDPGNCGPTALDPQWGHEYLGWRPINDSCGEGCPMNRVGFAVTTTSSSSSGAASSSSSSSASSAQSTSATSSSTTASALSSTQTTTTSAAGSSPPSSSSSLSGAHSTTSSTPSSSASSSSGGVANSAAAYGVAAVVVIVIIIVLTIGYLAARRGRQRTAS